MTDSGSIITFVLVSFCLAIILIMKKDSLPAQMKRYLALLAIIMVSLSFVLILISFFGAGM
ncbi:ABC-type dipeptide/oligopeptide/nickel transport system permease component [Paenibacillus sp. V4I3]|uniref:hypothetical protein n=1 Tax=unclassified Paenibacillus TaxID=185978 RepID=UPI0027843BAA|nr:MULTISPECIES: hypothetical protein [unclassified Paenibacillus]MDQ0874075.1 ABC-type dipeptide/oligopeptide/nickel transport system permease component [Paenibacillus sp. V4I3]MDQ0890048.1 ABC-type dipeptide/oligopeptide/nickel transport system permease component [Paenibacillus sp. V4I9]